MTRPANQCVSSTPYFSSLNLENCPGFYSELNHKMKRFNILDSNLRYSTWGDIISNPENEMYLFLQLF
jgi:hypothetical protein